MQQHAEHCIVTSAVVHDFDCRALAVHLILLRSFGQPFVLQSRTSDLPKLMLALYTVSDKAFQSTVATIDPFEQPQYIASGYQKDKVFERSFTELGKSIICQPILYWFVFVWYPRATTEKLSTKLAFLEL